MWLNIPTAAHTTTLPPPALLLPSFVFWKLLTIHSCPVTFNQQGDRFPATGCDVTGPPVSLQFYPFVQKQNTSVTSGWEAVGCSDLLIIVTDVCAVTHLLAVLLNHSSNTSTYLHRWAAAAIPRLTVWLMTAGRRQEAAIFTAYIMTGGDVCHSTAFKVKAPEATETASDSSDVLWLMMFDREIKPLKIKLSHKLQPQ